MAIRKCGSVTIKCQLVPAPHMPHGEQKRCVQYVGIPRSLSQSIDSPAAYSDAAGAALSFAMDEGKIGSHEVEYNSALTDYRMQRPKKRRA